MTVRLTHLAPTALILALVALCLALAACSSSGRASASATPAPADTVRAQVNDGQVKQSDVDVVRGEARLEGRDQSAGKALAEAIDRELVWQEARRLGVAPDAAAIEARAAAVAQQAGGASGLATLLARASMTKEQLRASLAYGLARAAVQDARYPGVKAAAAEVRRFYDRNRGELFTTPASVRLGAVVTRNKGIGTNALKRLRQGHSLEEVSRQFSTDPQLKDSGGDMGWVYVSSLPAELRTVVRHLRVGQVSSPSQAMGGWYILKLLGSRPQAVTPFSEIRDEVQKELTRQRRSAALDKWLDQARDKAAIQRS